MAELIERDIAKWYRDTVQFIVDLPPNTMTKDDAIPGLPRQQPEPTFVTINERDFWQKVAIDLRYCVVCFALQFSRAGTAHPTSLLVTPAPSHRAE